MAIQHTSKTYPMLKWLLGVSLVLVVVGVIMSDIASDPDNADIQLLIIFVVVAAILPFLALVKPRRETVVLELPSDHVAKTSRQELQGILDQLEKAHAKGEIPDERYQKARDKILKQQKAQKAK
jgi:Na+/melibiose symporter-like transporter